MKLKLASIPVLITLCFLWGGALFVSSAKAQSPVTLTINAKNQAKAIPADFTGLSIEIGSLRNANGGVAGNWFDDSTTWPEALHLQMVTLFRNLGIRNIRVGGGSVDQNDVIPTNDDIDAFFRFVKAAKLNVIYSFRLLKGDTIQNETIARYVWSNYGSYVRTFSVGNEPDFHSYHSYPGHIVDSTIYETTAGVPGTAFPSYLKRWKLFAASLSTAAPGVKFGGPDTGSNYPVPSATGTFANTYYLGRPWTAQFADSSRELGSVSEIYLHNYAGQGASGTPQGMADAMLSAAWDTSYYPALYNSSCVPVLESGLPYRLTESNSFSGGVEGGSTCFATSLFGLDYLHWWSSHEASGVNFHNKQWVLNDAIFMDGNGNYQVHPLAYGMAALNIGCHGKPDSVLISNPDHLNLTAYAVTDSSGRTHITIINREHSSGVPFSKSPRDAKVVISADGMTDTACVMYLTAAGGSVLATSGISLGGATITNSASFVGKWSPIDTVEAGHYVVSVPYSSAAILRIGGPFEYLPVPIAVAPKGDSSVPRFATLKWSSSRGSYLYDLQISKDSKFRTTVLDTVLADTVLTTPAALDSVAKYYWHVRSTGSLYNGSYTQLDSFTTGSGLLAIVADRHVPEGFALMQNYPNPFNPATTITYRLPASSMVVLNVYDVLGRLIATPVSEVKAAGTYDVKFDAGRLPSGVYFYRLSAGSYASILKMMHIK